jgi:hypothetical protein
MNWERRASIALVVALIAAWLVAGFIRSCAAR